MDDLMSCGAHSDTVLNTLRQFDICSLLCVLHWFQSLSSFPSIVSSLIALLPPEYPLSSLLLCPHFRHLFFPLLFLSPYTQTQHTHAYTQAHRGTHISSGPESGRAAAKGLTNAG